MAKPAWTIVCLVVASLFWPGRALPQTVSPEALAAAKEFMIASKMGDQIKTALPHIMQQLKPLIAKGNPTAERDFDALIPVMMQAMDTHLDGYLNAGAQIYARHLSAEEIRQLTSMYRTPVMEKFLQKQPEIMKESVALGNKFGEVVAKDLQSRMTEELRKRGHNI